MLSCYPSELLLQLARTRPSSHSLFLQEHLPDCGAFRCSVHFQRSMFLPEFVRSRAILEEKILRHFFAQSRGRGLPHARRARSIETPFHFGFQLVRARQLQPFFDAETTKCLEGPNRRLPRYPLLKKEYLYPAWLEFTPSQRQTPPLRKLMPAVAFTPRKQVSMLEF